MVDKKLPLVTPGQRIDQPDYQDFADSVETFSSSDAAAVLSGQASFIVAGFTPSGSGGAATVTITRDESSSVPGAAILARRTASGVTYGHIVAGGSTTRTISTANLADGAYTAYVKFELRDTDLANVVLWNADVTTGGPIEVSQPAETRKTADWLVTTALTSAGSPGAEWLKVATFSVTSGVLSGAVADARVMLFEGDAAQSWDPDNEWGDGANDRNANRGLYGVKNLHTAVRALQRQTKDILTTLAGSSQNWWTAAVSYASSIFLARDGSNTITGNILPDSNNTRDLGAVGAAFSDIYGTLVSAATVNTSVLTATLATLAGIDTTTVTAGTASFETRLINTKGGTNLVGVRRIIRVQAATTVSAGSVAANQRAAVTINLTPGTILAAQGGDVLGATYSYGVIPITLTVNQTDLIVHQVRVTNGVDNQLTAEVANVRVDTNAAPASNASLLVDALLVELETTGSGYTTIYTL